MRNVFMDFGKPVGAIKPMHAVNNGPIHKEGGQNSSNMQTFTEAGIPYARNHDAAFCSSYGGEHSVDISAVFPDFDADPYTEASYDFVLTDVYSKQIEQAGAKVFYRLGSKIEHAIKKYGTLVPKDFKKWAVICEHIIRHYTEGWANGPRLDIEYWEIWNEPDLDPDDSNNKLCWGGTAAEFFELYTTAAVHLKSRFPHLKIGGPALAGNLDWAERFLKHISQHKVPLDFFSWHIYTTEPQQAVERANAVKALLNTYGYAAAESILNEWNYVKDWGKDFVKSVETIISLKGAAFTAACMCTMQNTSVDMLMYYDARPSAFNGLFDFYTLRPLKGYYPFKMFNELYKAKTQVECKTDAAELYALAAISEDKQAFSMLTYYTDRDDAPAQSIRIEARGAANNAEIYLLDDTHSNELTHTVISASNTFELEMQPNTVALIRFKS